MEDKLRKITEIVNRKLEIRREELMRENIFPFHCINALQYMKNKPLYYNIYSNCWGGERELILRGFCFGCDEGRKGKTLYFKKKIKNIEYNEMICKGCKDILDKIQDTMIPIIQCGSHEGYISWRISYSDFIENKDLNIFLSDNQSDENSVLLTATDDGSMEQLVAALVKAKYKDVETFTKYLKDNDDDYFLKYEGDLEKIKNFPFIKYSEIFDL